MRESLERNNDKRSAIDELLSIAPFSLDAERKHPLLMSALLESYRHHFDACPAFRKYCERRGLSTDSKFERLEDFPFLPVQAFKEHFEMLQSVSDPSQIKVKLQSSATSGVPSTVLVDGITAKRQVRALASVLAEVFGPKRRPFLVLDGDPQRSPAGFLGARGAAVRGFLNLAREAHYLMDLREGDFRFDCDQMEELLKQFKAAQEPVVVLGFTYVLYIHAVLRLKEQGRRMQLPPGSYVMHIGGWKKLEDRKVDRSLFNRTVADVFGISEEAVIDFYGFTEQMGVTYPDNQLGNKQTPVFSEVIVRDPVTYQPLPDGQAGVLQFLSPVPHSYPGFSVLTDDLGVVVDRNNGRGPSKWRGTEFRVLGRLKNAEVRGCGDIMGEKIERVRSRAVSPELHVLSDVRLFADSKATSVALDINAPVALSSLPVVKSISKLADELKKGREVLDSYSVDELIALIGAAARRWVDETSPLSPLRQNGLLFLANWCRPTALRGTADRALVGGRGVLDGFRSLNDSGNRLYMAQARGLVCHWLSGNVPLLGMLTLAQSILARNANLLKVASTFSSVLPILLDAFRGLEVIVAGGRTLRGDDILKSIAVVYFSKDDLEAAEAFSLAADVRLAWGGKEAVEAVMSLPRKYGTEDLIFGPKLSFMAIGKEYLSSERLVRKMARLAAVDASVFDQYACASPHTIFVERGGSVASPKEFAERLASEMGKVLLRIPKQPPDAGTVSNIVGTRLKYEFDGSLWSSVGTEWTVLYDDGPGTRLPDPCYSRVITVRAIDDILDAARFAHRGIQTVGLALDGSRRLEFAKTAATQGAERFPDIGRMTYFDSPWDGVFPIDRMVRWISLGGPY